MIRRIFQDKLFLLVVGAFMMVYMMLPHLNPPANQMQAEPPGNVAVFIEWEPGPHDVDLWVTGPGEPKPVGYSNKSGRLWNLLRDDLGTSNDRTPSNHETSYTRGIEPGEYIINVHCFNCRSLPMRVDVEISVKRENTVGMKGIDINIIAITHVILKWNKQEKTAIRFRLDSEGDLVPDSVTNVYHKMKGTVAGHLGSPNNDEDDDYDE